MKKIFFPVITIFLVLGFLGCNENIVKDSNLPLSKNSQISSTIVNTTLPVEISEDVIKNSMLVNVPFASQAPFSNWGDPYQEACEETSIIIANEFLKNNVIEDLDKNFVDNEIKNMVDWENSNWGGHYDLDAEKTIDLFKNYYGANDLELKNLSSTDDIKRILSQGYIIIAPTYGQKLNNPHFTPPGPVYHMLVVKGYDAENFITNDPGVWQGKNFTYSFDNLYSSICDLPTEAVMKKGFIKENKYLMDSCQKNVIIVKK